MQAVFEKIIEQLKDRAMEFLKDSYDQDEISKFELQYFLSLNINRVEEVVNKIAEEYDNGWISVEKQLPKEPKIGIVDMEDLQEYIVMIDGADKATSLYYAGNGEWYREGVFYRVSAWQQYPDPITNEKKGKWSDGKKLYEIISEN